MNTKKILAATISAVVSIGLMLIVCQIIGNKIATDIMQRKNATEPHAASVLDSNISVGDIVTFGTYEQDNNLDNGTEPIEWRVLDINEKNNRALLLSDKALDCISYHDEWVDITWEECTLRKWLNDDFYYGAFSEEERNGINQSRVQNPDNIEYKTEGGNDTDDYVFLLSIDEANTYFENNGERKCKPTEYAIAKGCINWEGLCGWWLRSPGGPRDHALLVDEYCTIDCFGSFVYDDSGVRPALWVDLTAITETTIAEGKEERKDNITPVLNSNLSIGDVITFGTYEQDNNLDNGTEPIEWRVLDVDNENSRALLLSEQVLDAITYHEDCEAVTWEESALRKWLNDEFYYGAFSEEERNGIIQSRVQNPDNPEYGTEGGNDTDDYVFLLSIDEANAYFNYDDERRCKPTEYATANDITVWSGYGTCLWWLRSPGIVPDYASCVDCLGGVSCYGTDVDFADGGIRPALWVDLSNL